MVEVVVVGPCWGIVMDSADDGGASVRAGRWCWW